MEDSLTYLMDLSEGDPNCYDRPTIHEGVNHGSPSEKLLHRTFVAKTDTLWGALDKGTGRKDATDSLRDLKDFMVDALSRNDSTDGHGEKGSLSPQSLGILHEEAAKILTDMSTKGDKFVLAPGQQGFSVLTNATYRTLQGLLMTNRSAFEEVLSGRRSEQGSAEFATSETSDIPQVINESHVEEVFEMIIEAKYQRSLAEVSRMYDWVEEKRASEPSSQRGAEEAGTSLETPMDETVEEALKGFEEIFVCTFLHAVSGLAAQAVHHVDSHTESRARGSGQSSEDKEDPKAPVIDA